MAGPIACRLKLIQRKYTQQSAKKGKNLQKKGENVLQVNDASSKTICTILLEKGFFKISKSKLHVFS